MDAKITRGNFAGFPYRKTVVNIGSADAGMLVGAATGLAKVLAIGAAAAAGGLSLAAALLGGVQNELEIAPFSPKDEESNRIVPLGSGPARIQSRSQEYWGIILDESFTLDYEGQELSLPLFAVKSIAFHNASWRIDLLDGSQYGVSPHHVHKMGQSGEEVIDEYVKEEHLMISPLTDSIQVAAIGGVRNVSLYRKYKGFPIGHAKIEASIVKDIKKLRVNLEEALTIHRQGIIELVGSETLRTFFNI